MEISFGNFHTGFLFISHSVYCTREKHAIIGLWTHQNWLNKCCYIVCHLSLCNSDKFPKKFQQKNMKEIQSDIFSICVCANRCASSYLLILRYWLISLCVFFLQLFLSLLNWIYISWTVYCFPVFLVPWWMHLLTVSNVLDSLNSHLRKLLFCMDYLSNYLSIPLDMDNEWNSERLSSDEETKQKKKLNYDNW